MLDVIIIFISIVLLLLIIFIYKSIKGYAKDQQNALFKRNIINPDNLTGPNHINNLVLKAFFLYSVYLSFTILSDPTLIPIYALFAQRREIYNYSLGLQTMSLLTYQNEFTIILFLIGLLYTLKSVNKIKIIKKNVLISEINKINEKYLLNYEKFIKISSRTNHEKTEEDLSQLSSILKAFQDEKKRILSRNRDIYDLKTWFAFLSSLLLPIISSIVSKYLHSLILN